MRAIAVDLAGLALLLLLPGLGLWLVAILQQKMG